MEEEIKQDTEVTITEPEKRPSEDELRQELARIRDEAEAKKKNKTAKIIGIVVIAVIVVVLLTLGIMALRGAFSGNKNSVPDSMDGTTTISSGQTIKLDEHGEGLAITGGGEYNLTGRVAAPVVVDSVEDVTLRLNGATIETASTAAIASVGKGALTIELIDGTENNLSDGGESEYDGCIFSTGPLTITGSGKLNVYGQQNEGEGIATESNNLTIEGGDIYIESNDDGLNAGGDGGTITINGGNLTIKAGGDGIDSNKDLVINGGLVYAMGSAAGGNAGIDTDGGYTINGGTVVVLGTDMLEAPKTNSGQNTLALNLSNNIASGTMVTLTDNNDNAVISFVAKESFKTLIISTPELKNGSYKLYTGGSNSGKLENNFYSGGSLTGGSAVTAGNTAVFTITSTVTTVGATGGPGGAPMR
ncbi:carbohydrate-binding domain-containing protein [Candidatus Saccharibacteria bacterium]|nr:carbohydrate-binding domain-containing protein [Candidatus Saccharibacteria bacterium]